MIGPQDISSIKIHPLSLNSTDRVLEDTIKERIALIEGSPQILGSDDSFFIADLAEVQRLYATWKAHLPYVKPHYAVKCNPDPMLLRCLIQLGIGFDCASIEEMQTVLNLCVAPNNIIFANPCKSSSALVFASNSGIRMTTFDNLDDLDAVKTYMPHAQLILRIFANDDSALSALGDKFGAHMESTPVLLERAKELDLAIVGVSFHIGKFLHLYGRARNPDIMKKAITDARLVWSAAEKLGFNMTVLDIGGGFHSSKVEFQMMANAVNESFSTASFPKHVTVVAEPGRFFAKTVYTLVCRVISRRRRAGDLPCDEPEMLYQNDGVFRNFMNALFEGEIFTPAALVESSTTRHMQRQGGPHTYRIWGPTCDSSDCITRKMHFTCEVKVDDWLIYRNMGAYASVTATRFNGFSSQTKTFYTFIERNHDVVINAAGQKSSRIVV
ncbi:uncharacterized protein PV09_09652 [Verruconis gallopava]|uniref:ornithine decarboxylase n=1 Tax=Verruconis gallopava TaxID=253628 RepID=A0A0D1X919_9PEZI|nr:uncharacterized protein PV09_09652 [Verruconis gallopava]KIV98545.1 hypothetical protein PV09_09652 [Verruconis gallopava]